MEISLTGLGVRLKQYLDFKRIGINQLGRMLGSSGALVSNILNGKNFGMSKFIAIGSACPDLNLIWLLTGKEEMLLNGTTEKANPLVEQENQIDAEILKKQNEFLQNKLEHKINSLESAIAYQDMTIEAYKNTLSIVTDSNKDLKELLNNHIEIINKLTGNKKIA